MKIPLYSLKNKVLNFEETVDLNYLIKEEDYLIRKFNKVLVKVKSTFSNDIIHLDINIFTDLVLMCCRTLKDIPYKKNINESLDFTNNKDFYNEDIIFIKENVIDLDPYIYGIIYAYIPLYPKLEEESIESKKDEHNGKKSKNSIFDVLDNLDLD